ncbi:2,3,4,5-tetrahydropyridine-2,6-dicarboxylate N-succinyltransferase [Raoultella planticola]|uniref:2,3,4,5-tetrahydropyridine-2,6-dicarboxylate N-succinyltransferase n=1 Tax=Raoultella planticola TaxID=575 RepID=A0A485B1X0_RAOPL|nr:2,3,4,5-tetrahydropyridine-2,6-dicarboxylate N-succinyltransferase [Raoultella planticola]
MKFADYDEARFQKEGFRVVPPAAVRQGAFIARNTVLMPSYVNIGAYVDEGLHGRYLGHRGFLRADR